MNRTPRAATWQVVGRRSPADLTDARLQFHWAVQLIAAAGASLVAPRPDDSHRGMVFDADEGVFAGELTTTDPPIRVCVRATDPAVLLVDRQGALLDAATLTGVTLEEARQWTAAELARVLSREASPLAELEYEIPDHAVGRGERFAFAERDAVEELVRWYANAQRVLEGVAFDSGGSSVRVWPHHFDVGFLITLDAGADPELARSVGVGFSPGDDGTPEPYWYVNAYPRPDLSAADLPPLPAGGRWNTEGWFGAVLTGSAVVATTSAEEQRVGSLAFLNAAIGSARAMLGG